MMGQLVSCMDDLLAQKINHTFIIRINSFNKCMLFLFKTDFVNDLSTDF